MEPNATRPYMPGYGILPATEGTGLLPWSWAVERLSYVARLLGDDDVAGRTAAPHSRVGSMARRRGVVQLQRLVPQDEEPRTGPEVQHRHRQSVRAGDPRRGRRTSTRRPSRSRRSPTPSTSSTRPTTASTSSPTTRCGAPVPSRPSPSTKPTSPAPPPAGASPTSGRRGRQAPRRTNSFRTGGRRRSGGRATSGRRRRGAAR